MRVVVTGMGVVSPVGNSVEVFWNNLKKGFCGIEKIDESLAEQWPAKLWACVKDFDPAADGVDPAFVRKMDQVSVYGMAAANQAMKQSGLVSGENVMPGRFGVYFGSGVGGFQTTYDGCVKMESHGAKWVSPMLIPTLITNITAGGIAIKHNAQGPCMSVSTACATGSHAIGEAYRAIKHGYADAMLCGGAEAANIGLAIAGFGNMRALSKSEDPMRASLPFNADRGGFVLGEGAGALVLESYDNAVKRGATILAELCGYGSTCDAYHLTAPRSDASTQAEAMKMALKSAKFCGRRDVLYVNAHGTGTALNDVCETKAFHLALGRNAKKAHISSTKSCTGHLMGAAGAVEAVASVMALCEGVVPPTIGLDKQDPECDLNYTPNKAVKAGLTIAVSDSLGFGGHNACLAFRRIQAPGDKAKA